MSVVDTYKALYHILDTHERKRGMLVLIGMFGVSISEVAGVASVMPFLSAIADPVRVMSHPLVVKSHILDVVSTPKQFLIVLGGIFIAILLTSLVIRGFGLWMLLRFSTNRDVAWSSRLLAASLKQPYGWYLGHNSAELTRAVISDVDMAINEALMPALQVISQVGICVLLLGTLVLVDPVLAGTVGVVLGGGFWWISHSLRDRQRRIGVGRVETWGQRLRVTQDAFVSFKEVKLGGIEGEVLRRFIAPSKLQAALKVEAGVFGQIPPLAMQGLLFGGMVGILLFLLATRGDLAGALPIVGLYAFAGFRLLPAIQKIFEEFGKLRVSEHVVKLLATNLAAADSVSAPHAIEDAQKLGRLELQESVSLTDISFRYADTERPVLDGVSIEIPARTSLGIVGSTGSGKSTLVDIILGLQFPERGSVKVDGHDISDPTMVCRWQKNIGYIPQQIFLSDESITANIAFGVPPEQVDHVAIERAARLAAFHDFVEKELPERYNTIVGDRGIRLSGGQRQRIGIARALYHDPDIIIMDEATSALDNLTEQAVMSSIQALAKTKTVIMIAHRLTSIKDCDQIVMLGSGKVLGVGRYEELMATNSAFRALTLSDAHAALAAE